MNKYNENLERKTFSEVFYSLTIIEDQFDKMTIIFYDDSRIFFLFQ